MSRSTGNGSTGDWSTGDWSTGDWSTGDWSTGYRSTGDGSTGDWSTGNRSTGDWSTGNRSTGNRSTGDGSTGDWSISDYSTGHFSTIDYSGFSVFDKPCSKDVWEGALIPDFLYNINITKWVQESEMTNEEKINNKTFHTTGGYLKTIPMKEAWRVAWDGADERDREKLFNLPNFDAEVFKKISGIDVNAKKEETINVEGKDLTIAELKQMIKEKEGK